MPEYTTINPIIDEKEWAEICAANLIAVGLGTDAVGIEELFDQVSAQIYSEGVTNYVHSLINEGIVAELAGGEGPEALISTLYRNVTGTDLLQEYLIWAVEATQSWSTADIIFYAVGESQSTTLVGLAGLSLEGGVDFGSIL